MKIEVFADGSCIGNPGPGGWAALVKGDGHTYAIQGGDPQTTNNRMELTGAINGIKTALFKFPKLSHVDLYSDSSYLVNTMSRGWKKKKNTDLWLELDQLILQNTIKISWHWIKGHNGHKENEDCDARALKEAIKFCNKRIFV